jgi:hypothetical protein
VSGRNEEDGEHSGFHARFLRESDRYVQLWRTIRGYLLQAAGYSINVFGWEDSGIKRSYFTKDQSNLHFKEVLGERRIGGMLFRSDSELRPSKGFRRGHRRIPDL